MTEYLGYDVLEIEPSRENAAALTSARQLERLDSASGKLGIVDKAGLSLAQRGAFLWVMTSRAEVEAFRQFRAARRGKLVPCWVPTWEADLALAEDVAADATGIVVARCGYTRFCFPSPARRYIALIAGASKVYRRITAASEGTDTETLTLDAPPGVAFAVAGSLVSYLLLCRLTEDDVSLEWENTEAASAALTFAEQPLEVPA